MNAAHLEPSLPSTWYRSTEVFKTEKERIFCREWIGVCREEELAQPGDYLVLEVLGESVLLVRNRAGQLRAFYNVCRHRGSRLCRTPAEYAAMRVALPGGVTLGRIVCPYHQWSYDFDGALIAAPHLSASAGFKKQDFHLYPVGVDSWGGFVFVNLTPAEAKPLSAQLGGIPERLRRYPLGNLRIGATRRYEVAANWKILCENYNECYHCGGVHPELCAVVPSFRDAGGANLDWSRGIPHREGAYTFTHSGTSARRAFPGLDADEQVRHKGELVYPNLFLSVACDHVAAFILQPRNAELTDITCHFLFEAHEMAKPTFDPSDAVDFWDLVNRQDWAVCAGVQSGIRSRVHAMGYYAPMEDWNLDIRRYVTERIGAFVEEHPP
ncbi:MAG TPA: aromatic ring-hydroxylating dioxygenase subunit alpha [Steroidobacteraceae bacterium]|nr:aromatic ring-hydroxylating dioxygenase subunit alpha [Steroidobacteraceae bacterium]